MVVVYGKNYTATWAYPAYNCKVEDISKRQLREFGYLF